MKTKNKVYCENCKYFQPFQPFLKAEDCGHENAWEGNYLTPKTEKIPPHKRSKNNDCEDFEEKSK